MYIIHIGLCADAFADALLVGDKDKPPEMLLEMGDGTQKILPEHQFRRLFHIVAYQLHVDHTVAVQKQSVIQNIAFHLLLKRIFTNAVAKILIN